MTPRLLLLFAFVLTYVVKEMLIRCDVKHALSIVLCLCLAVTATASEGEGDEKSLPQWAQLLLAFCLVCLSALFAGLTIGIMGLDTLSLEIIASSGSEPDKSYAEKLLPVRRMGHQALCTLVLGNMWANVMIAEFCADINPEGGGGDEGGNSGLVGFLLSTLIILIFTEIMPMSICKSSNALKIAAGGVPILKVFLVLLYPISKPLGMLLDKIIHHDPGQIYDRKELKRLMVLHCDAHGDRSGLQKTELSMMLGAMEFHEVVVGDIMTKIDKVFMVSEEDILDDNMVRHIWQKGHSRIPVYCGESRQSIVGVLYAKDLVLILSEKTKPSVGEFLIRTQRRTICTVSRKLKLPAMLKQLQSGRAHLFIVEAGDPEDLTTSVTSFSENRSTQIETVGIITLEDIIEKLIGSDILDEDDESVSKRRRVNFQSFEVSQGDLPRQELTEDQWYACASYLHNSVESFAHWPLEQLRNCLVKAGSVIEIHPSEAGAAGADTTDIQRETLYESGKPTDVFTLVLCGRVDVIVGNQEHFRSNYGRFSWLAEGALHGEKYVPNFTAIVRQPTKILQLNRAAYEKMDLKFQ